MKTILVPVDLSDATAPVCEAAFRLARLMQAKVLLLHVVEQPPFLMNDYYAFDTGAMAAVMAAGTKESALQLKKLGASYAKRGVPVRTIQVSGPPVPAITAKAKSTRAAYVVLGSHGHGAVFDLFVGSTTQGVLRKARCSVLVVPITKN